MRNSRNSDSRRAQSKVSNKDKPTSSVTVKISFLFVLFSNGILPNYLVPLPYRDYTLSGVFTTKCCIKERVISNPLENGEWKARSEITAAMINTTWGAGRTVSHYTCCIQLIIYFCKLQSLPFSRISVEINVTQCFHTMWDVLGFALELYSYYFQTFCTIWCNWLAQNSYNTRYFAILFRCSWILLFLQKSREVLPALCYTPQAMFMNTSFMYYIMFAILYIGNWPSQYSTHILLSPVKSLF